MKHLRELSILTHNVDEELVRPFLIPIRGKLQFLYLIPQSIYGKRVLAWCIISQRRHLTRKGL